MGNKKHLNDNKINLTKKLWINWNVWKEETFKKKTQQNCFMRKTRTG
jgi:hypothetical protein